MTKIQNQVAVTNTTGEKKSMQSYIKAMEGEIKKALPSVITPERFTRMVLSAISVNPKLATCTKASFLGAMMNAAQLGLEPNTPLGQAYILPYQNKGVLEAQFQIGYKGLIDLAYRSGEVELVQAHIVYCKFVNDEVLYATENEQEPVTDEMGNVVKPPMSETGWYDHGLYPFIFDVLFATEGTPAGFGYIDVGKDAQGYIDRGNQAIMANMLANAKPRFFIGADGSVNEEEFADMSRDFIHVDGNLGQDSIIAVQGKPLNNVYVQVVKDKVDELKETTGNRDISTGGTTSGVTAASAIAAMQEAGSKLARDGNKSAYRSYRKLCLMIIELIRQFYDLPRCFRIMGENGTARYVQYSNAGITPQMQGVDFGVDMGQRVPLFDIEVTAQKQSPYSKMSQNELALQFYQAGFFNPQMSDQALACLDMMDFDRKEFIMQKISQNGTMYQMMMQMQQQMMMLAQMVDQARGSNIAQQLMAQFSGGAPVAAIDGSSAPNIEKTEALGGEEGKGEAKTTKKARQRVAESTDPT